MNCRDCQSALNGLPGLGSVVDIIAMSAEYGCSEHPRVPLEIAVGQLRNSHAYGLFNSIVLLCATNRSRTGIVTTLANSGPHDIHAIPVQPLPIPAT